MTSKLVETREPTTGEKKRGAEIVFVRKDEHGKKHTILASRCYESWEQWGAYRELLSDNVDTVENWRRNLHR